MKKLIMTIVVMVASMAVVTAQNFGTDNAQVSFFSKAPISDVDAVNNSVTIELNTVTQELTCSIVMKEFEFKSDKMGRDAEKKYIEIDAYPHASFIGKIGGNIDYTKPGSYPATASGMLTIHGVAKKVEEIGNVTVQKGEIKVVAQFNVRLKDYNIDTPKILGQEMTEDHMLVKVNATLIERPKKAITQK